MHLPARQLLWSATLAAVAAALTLNATALLADEMAGGFDTSGLVRFGEQPGISYEDWVSTDALVTHTVKKIEAGRVSYVTIAETSTGTYSSDGLESRHVQYPGIIEPKPLNEFSFSSWNNGSWNRISTRNAHSYVSVSTYRNHRGETRTSTCVASASFLYC